MEKLPRKRKTDDEKKEKRKGSRKKYENTQHNIRMNRDVFERWEAAKTKEGIKTNNEMTKYLLDMWDSFQDPNILHVQAKEDADQPDIIHSSSHLLQSTPRHATVSKHIEFDPMISDISGQDEPKSELSGVEEISLLEKYQRKAQMTEGSYINISFEVALSEHDESYKPTLSEEEEAYDEDEDLFSSSSEDEGDFELDMSLRQDESVDDLPVLAMGDAIFNIGQSDDEEIDTGTDSESEENLQGDLVKEVKAICFENNLLFLAKVNVSSKCNRKNCDGLVSSEIKYIGTAARITWKCLNGHVIKKWSSQPKLKKRNAGDLLLSAAILSSGNNFDKIKLMFNFFGMGIVAKTTHYNFQSKHSVPVVKNEFQTMIEQNLNKYRGQSITVAGDGRMDSPGHSAQYCTYTLLEYQSKDIVACEIIDKRECDLKSTSMEKEGLRRCLEMLAENGIKIRELCTDASTTIAAFVAKEHPDTLHSFDTWHGAKNFGKKLGAVAAEKKNQDLRPWVPDLINHFWYCSRRADGKEDAILGRWRGALHHVVNVHEWALGDNATEGRCEHDDLNDPNDPGGKKSWIEPGCHAHTSLCKVLLDTRQLRNLRFYVNFRHTGDLETFHDHILMYCAKRFSYKYPVYKARNFLACLDYQHHLHRPALRTKKGEPRLHRMYCKKNNNWTCYEEKEPKKYSYIGDLLTAILKHYMECDERLTSPIQMTPSDPRKKRRTIAKVSPPPSKELMQLKRSRFEK